MFDVEQGSVSGFLDWYRGRHLPDLLASGFLSARAFESEHGSPRFVTIYEQDHDVLQSPAYAAARASDPSLDSHESKVCNLQKATYRRIPVDRQNGATAFDARWVGVLGFEVREEFDDEWVAWLNHEALERGAGEERWAVGLRLGGHPLFPGSVAPRVLLIVESPSGATELEPVRSRLRERFTSHIDETRLIVAERYFSG